jgi:hypothetical protein
VAPPPQQPPQSLRSGPTEQQRQAFSSCMAPAYREQAAKNQYCLDLAKRGAPDSQVRPCGAEAFRIFSSAYDRCLPLLR